MSEISHEKCTEVLEAFAAKAKESENIAQYYAMEYAKSDKPEAKVSYNSAIRDAGTWREASSLFSRVRISK
jgi:hypothetical protein